MAKKERTWVDEIKRENRRASVRKFFLTTFITTVLVVAAIGGSYYYKYEQVPTVQGIISEAQSIVEFCVDYVKTIEL